MRRIVLVLPIILIETNRSLENMFFVYELKICLQYGDIRIDLPSTNVSSSIDSDDETDKGDKTMNKIEKILKNPQRDVRCSIFFLFILTDG